jgi:anti-sigma B factor antagonist
VEKAERDMRIDVNQCNGVTLVRPQGERLDLEMSVEFRAILLRAIEAGRRQLVVDLAAIEFIDSSGLGALVTALKALRAKKDGDIRLASLQQPVVALLEVTRLNRVFSSYSTAEQAVQSFGSHEGVA